MCASINKVMLGPWMQLDDIPTGALFETRDGVIAMKSEYHYDNGSQWQCVLYASGEYAHFPNKNREQVREIWLVRDGQGQ